MILSVKKKIWLGTLFLFLLLLITGTVTIYYVIKLKSDAKNVLQANYESLAYCHNMQQQLHNLPENYAASVKAFESALKQQQHNITESGEKEATASLQMNLVKLKSGDTSRKNILALQQALDTILHLNMQAIKRKSLAAELSAANAFTIIISICGLVFLIAFTFIVNFPSIITTPIEQLSEAIKEITGKNYKYRIHISNKDEFGKLADAFNNMAQRLENFENSNLNKLIFEKDRAEAVINSLKDASIGITKNERVLFANQQALQLLGLRIENVVGKPVDELKKRNDLFNFLLTSDTSAPFKIVVENRENYFIKEVIEVTQDNTQNKVIVLKNITSFKELDVAKTNFIATVSHELKTPLASSDLSLKLLEDERISQLSHEQKELIKNLKQDNQRMLKILSELLNMSQLETGKIQLNIQTIQPEVIISDALNTVAASAKQKNITIKNVSDNSLPFVYADKDKATWVLNNLLTNAIKYSYDNSAIIIKAYRQNSHLIFSITDHGSGIEQQYVPKLFDKYFQVPGSNEKGTGLGLSISKEFIEAQQGNIWVESEVNKGSVFYFSLLTA